MQFRNQHSETIAATQTVGSGIGVFPTVPKEVAAAEQSTLSHVTVGADALCAPPRGTTGSVAPTPGMEPTPELALAEGLPLPFRTSFARWIGWGMILLIAVFAGVWTLRYLTLSPTTQSPKIAAVQASSIHLGVVATLPGARIFIDDQLHGTADLVLELQPGTHQLRAEMEGSTPTTMPLDLKPNVTLRPMEIVLEPAAGTYPSDIQMHPGQGTPHPQNTSSPAKKKVIKSWTVAPNLTVESAPLPVTLRGYLQFKCSSANCQVVLEGRSEPQPRVLREDHLELKEGNYMLTATAPGFNKLTVPVRIEPSKTNMVELALQPVKEPEFDAHKAWPEPGSWTAEGEWLVHRGGDFLLSVIQPITGSYEFTLWRKSKSVQWALNHMGDRDYDLFEIDKKFLFRSRIRNGKKIQTTRIPHGLEKPVFYTVQLSVSPQVIMTKIFDGQTWVTLDEWKEAGPVVGKFGFYIPGKDQLGLSHFRFKPR